MLDAGSDDAARGELTIDFALHGHGAVSAWARQASPGHTIAIGGPRGSMVVPLDYDWHLLIGDATALPAIGRRLAELPEGARAIVLAQAEGLEAIEASRSRARVEWHRLEDDDALIQAVARQALPPGDGYAWAAGEARTMARVRERLLDKGHPREAMRVAAYWKRGAADFHADLTADDGSRA